MRKRERAYVVAILSVCIALVTVGFLALAAYSARAEDGVEKRRASLAAFYAAESGLILAETELAPKSKAPAVGVWLQRELPGGAAKFKLEILASGHSDKRFTVRSVGQAVGEQGQIHSTQLIAGLKRTDKAGWKLEWRSAP